MQLDVKIICGVWVRFILSYAAFALIGIFALHANFPGKIKKRSVILRRRH
jgi:hypothetical protein